MSRILESVALWMSAPSLMTRVVPGFIYGRRIEAPGRHTSFGKNSAGHTRELTIHADGQSMGARTAEALADLL